MYDALDTLWIMDLKDHFYEVVDLVKETKFDYQPNPVRLNTTICQYTLLIALRIYAECLRTIL